METFTIISTIATAIMAVVAVWSLIRTFKIEKMNHKIAEDQQKLSLRQLQSSVFFDIGSRYQELTKGLQDEANKRWYQQRFFDLCRDAFVQNKQGNLPREVWDDFVQKWILTIKSDRSFLTVWKSYAQIYDDHNFVTFFDNEIFRKTGLI